MTFTQTLERRRRDLHARQSYVDLHLSAAILMFSVIRADGDTDHLELARMVNILRSHYALASDEISNLVAAVRSTNVDDHGLGLLANKLCQHWSATERAQLLDDLWLLATADHQIRASECRVIKLIANNLELRIDDITQARIRAEQRLE